MNFKLFPLIVASAIALSFGAAPVIAQTDTTTPSTTDPSYGSWPQHGQYGAFQGINLTPQQEGEIEQIKVDTRAEIKNVLTQEQRDQLAAMPGKITGLSGNRQSRRTVIQDLNLTDEQKAELEQIKIDHRERIKDVLTPSQQKQYEQNLQSQRRR